MFLSSSTNDIAFILSSKVILSEDQSGSVLSVFVSACWQDDSNNAARPGLWLYRRETEIFPYQSEGHTEPRCLRVSVL